MRAEILVGSKNFMDSLRRDLLAIEKSIFVQAMTFEMDEAGRSLIMALENSKATDKRICVDAYSLNVINDKFILTNWLFGTKAFKEEVSSTQQLLRGTQKSAIKVKVTNPVGYFFQKYPFRNHKKMLILDEQIVYIGGINFSDHNFEWHDMMIRIENQEISRFLSSDFESTWNGRDQSIRQDVSKGSLYIMNGRKSRLLYDEIFSLIKHAKKSVEIISPYVSDPLLSQLKSISKKVTVDIYTPGENNKSNIKNMMVSRARKIGLNVFEYQKGMSHLKAILVDDQTLIFGSSNFDFVSYYCEQEVIMVCSEKSLVEDFKVVVLSDFKKNSTVIQFENYKVNHVDNFLINFAASFLRVYSKIQT